MHQRQLESPCDKTLTVFALSPTMHFKSLVFGSFKHYVQSELTISDFSERKDQKWFRWVLHIH